MIDLDHRAPPLEVEDLGLAIASIERRAEAAVHWSDAVAGLILSVVVFLMALACWGRA